MRTLHEKSRKFRPKVSPLDLFTRLTVLSFSLTIFSPLSHATLFSFPYTSVSAFLMNSVKSCFQNMEICKRRVNMYDTVNQSKTPFITHVAPSTSTNLTMTFNNQLNTVHNQVSTEHRRPAGLTASGTVFPQQTQSEDRIPLLSYSIL